MLKIQNPKYSDFNVQNPDFDILKFNFLNDDDIQSLNAIGADSADTLNELRAYQRLMRLYPDATIANTLLANNLDSAIKIAHLSQSVFIDTYSPMFGTGGDAIAQKIYAAAIHAKDRVMQLVASAKTVAGSANFNTMLFNHFSDDVKKPFQDLASYQDFFGSLDYCDCDDCKSIFGPAAYLVDLLRIIDKAITKANPEIDDGLHLFDRRPDLQTIELTCENTNNLVPYLQIVNKLLTNTLKTTLTKSQRLVGGDVQLTLANTYYPFNLPFNLPLQEIDIVISNKNRTLSDIARVLSKDTTLSLDEAMKSLHLSLETLNNLLTQNPTNLPAIESNNYGLTVTTTNLNGLNTVSTFLQQTGLALADFKQLLTEGLSAKEIFDVSGQYAVSSFGPNAQLNQQFNSITGTYGSDGTLKGTIDGQIARGQWTSATMAPPAQKGDFEFTFGTDGSSFTGKWSKGLGQPWETTAWNGTLNGTSTQGIIPHSLFINGTLPEKQYLSIVTNNDVDIIQGQNITTLDRLNRFMRLSALTALSYSDLNWILMTLNTEDISTATIVELAKIKTVLRDYALDINFLTALWYDLKTIGVGDGPNSLASFDQVFNAPVILQKTGKYYHPVIAVSPTSFVNPLYQDEPFLFVVNQDLYNKSNPTPAIQALVSNGQIISKGIPASQDDVLAIAWAAFGGVATIPLTVSNLSLLYRHVMLAKQLNVTVDRYVMLLKLLGYGQATAEGFQINAIIDRDALLDILSTVQQLQPSGFTVYDIDYLCNQTFAMPINPYVNCGYNLAAVPTFLDTARTLLTGTVCQDDSFAFSDLTPENSDQIVSQLVTLKVVDASGLIVADLLPADLNKIKIGDTKSPTLLTTSQKDFVSSKVLTIKSLQRDTFANQVSAFFAVNLDVAVTAIEGVRGKDATYLSSFLLKESAATTKTSRIFLLNLSKSILIQRTLGLNGSQYVGLCAFPQTFGLPGKNVYTLNALLTVIQLNTVMQALGDTDNKLIRYFTKVWTTSPAPVPADVQAELCGITGWDVQQYVNLIGTLLSDPLGCKTLNDVITINDVFDIAGDLGIDTYFLQTLNSTTSLAATVDNWSVYNSTAAKLLITVRGTLGSDAAQAAYEKLSGQIEEKKRDAMVFLCISALAELWSGIKTPQNLYEFLLIDPETSGQAETSLVEEAMNAAQLYLQRCRLNLEENVRISTDNIPEVWWEWMMSYRIWEANRKIFVYPENYVVPSLRKSKTSLFENLENTLMQGEVTADLVESAYIKYLDDFSLFAQLRNVDAYQTVVHDKERGPVDTLFLFARTQEQPYHFYYITREQVGNCTSGNQYLWTEWKNINIKIDAQHVTPIYAFNKLFVFWVEVSTNKESGGLTGQVGSNTQVISHSNTITKASIKYSYYNFDGKWIQPQILVADKVINVRTLERDIYGSFYSQFTDVHASCWKRVSVIKTQAENYVGDAQNPGEKLIVYFGPLANFDDLSIPPAVPNLSADTTSVYAFKKMLQDAYFNLEQMKNLNHDGYIPLCSHFVIDETSNQQIILNKNEYLVLANNTLSTFVIPSFGLEISDRVLAISTDYSTIATNNSDGIESEFTGFVNGPQQVSSSSFVIYPYIDANLSSTILTNITANMPGVIVNSLVTTSALALTIPALAAKLNLSLNFAQLVQTRLFELYYGSKILFSNLSHNAGVVPVKNQPNTFILNNNGEAFLLTAINNVIEVKPAILTPASFVSATVPPAMSQRYFTILSTAPNQYINSDGSANLVMLQRANAFSLGQLLGIPAPYTEATNILAIMNASSQDVVQKDFAKIDTQLRLTTALDPDCFVSSGIIDQSTSETYYKILSTPPNQYIFTNGSVDSTKPMSATTIAPLLGLQPGDASTGVVLFVLNSALNRITPGSFVSAAIDPATSLPYITPAASATYFTRLSTAPNNIIQPNGSVNKTMLKRISAETLGSLLTAPPDGFVVAKVFSVLKSTFVPATLGYVYSADTDAKKYPGMYYEHDTIYSLQFVVERISTGAINTISSAMSFGGIDSALELSIQQPSVTVRKPFNILKPATNSLVPPLQGSVIIPPVLITDQQVAFSGPYGMYYWELFFHTPFLVASMLNANQQFSDAESWLQYIFNPTMQKKYLTQDEFVKKRPLDIDEGTMKSLYSILTKTPNQYIDAKGVVTKLIVTSSPFTLSILLSQPIDKAQEILNLMANYYVSKPEMRAWQFNPFRNYVLQTLLQNLTSCAQTAVYNDDPFDPDGIARLRIGAYEKAIVMMYIDNLLDWGDYEFTQYSMESITMARMYYSYAYDLLGPRPISVGSCSDAAPVTFQDIAARYAGGAIPQFLIDMEHLSSSGPITPGAGSVDHGFNDLGYYFCIPDNDQLTAYWNRVEDRLYKIRHSLNIEGVAQPLPLFQPEINPMDLVRAAAQGGNVLSVASQQLQNISYYRFNTLIEQARTFTELVSEFGNSLVSALEKSDSEALAMLNLNQSKVILNMTLSVKNAQLEGLQNQLAGLQESLQSAQNRNQFYTALINAGFNSSENSALSFMQKSITVQEVAAGIQGVSIVGYLAPCIFGFSDGGMKFGDAINMGAQMLQTTSQILSQQGGTLETTAQYQRRADDWQLQKQTAQYDINQIQDQISSMESNITSSKQEIVIQQKSIDQNLEQISFYQNKFTSQELYQWMIGRISSCYFQAYKLALDTALTAQLAYQYELDRSDSFVTFSYWDSLHKGLLAADGLKLSLAQLQNAYLTNNKRRMEIEKTISLKSLNPEVFYAFISGPPSAKGKLPFSLTEELFDRDFPSHYCRRIKTVSISIPAVVGPYQNIHATLIQNTNLVVLKNDPTVVDYAIYITAPQHSDNAPTEPGADALRQNWASSQQIALSKGVDDSGLFVVNFEDQRYLPFEETGAVSTWTLLMPPDHNLIDFNSISDIIFTVKYTAKDGGEPFGTNVVNLYAKQDTQYQNLRVNSFDINQAFAANWYKLFSTAPDTNHLQTLTFAIPTNVVLPNLQNVKLNQIVIDLVTATGVTINDQNGNVKLKVGNATVPLIVTDNKCTISPSDFSSIARWQGVDWSILFTVTGVPDLCKNGQLDSSKLLDVLLFVGYTSDL